MPLEKIPFKDGPLDGKVLEVENWIDKFAYKPDDIDEPWHYIYRRNCGVFELLSKTDDLSQMSEMNPQMALIRLRDFVTDLSRETDMLRVQLRDERAKAKLEKGVTLNLDGKKWMVDDFDPQTREVKAVEVG